VTGENNKLKELIPKEIKRVRSKIVETRLRIEEQSDSVYYEGK
jgi:hypothetical protein